MHKLSASRRPPRVSRSTRSTAARAPGASRDRSPSTCTTTPWSRSSRTSAAMYSSSRLIRAEISVGGRCQFSSEKANSVSTSTPASIAPSTTSRTAFMPARCPRGRGRCRSSAQRPLPSMMMATWRGTAPASRICARRSSPMSDLHDLRLFGFDQLFHELHMVVVELLRVFLGVLLVVLGDVLGLLDPVDRFGAGAAHADAPFLGELVHDLHQRSEEHTSELQSRPHLVCRLLLEKKKKRDIHLFTKARAGHGQQPTYYVPGGQDGDR